MRVWHVMCLVCVLASATCSADPLTIFSSDFSLSTLGNYANGSTINANTAPTTDDLTIQLAGASNALRITSDGTLRTTHGTQSTNMILTNSLAQNSQWSQVSSGNGATDLNRIAVSFDIKPLVASAGGFRLLLNTTGDTSGSPNTLTQFEVSSSMVVQARNGGTTANGPTLSVNTTYHVELNLDMSSLTQDTWGYVITNADTDALVGSASNLSTRVANGTPTRLVVDFGSVGTTAVSANENFEFDNLSVVATPEPSAIAMVAVVGTMLMTRRKSASLASTER